MIEALHVGALVPATIGLCCTAAAPRRGLRAVAGWVPAAMMTAAMADAALGSQLLPAVLWTVLLVLASLLPAVQLRGDRARADRGAGAHASAMAVHRSLGTLLMGGLMLVLATPALAVAAAGASHHGARGGSAEWMLMAGAIGFIGLSAWLLGRVLRAPRPARLVALEVSAMALSVGVTAAALLA